MARSRFIHVAFFVLVLQFAVEMDYVTGKPPSDVPEAPPEQQSVIRMYEQGGRLVIDTPSADIFCLDLRPTPDYSATLNAHLQPEREFRERGSISCVKLYWSGSTDDDQAPLHYLAEDGLVCINFGEHFRITRDCAEIVMNGRKFPIDGPKRTIVVGENGEPRIADFRLKIVPPYVAPKDMKSFANSNWQDPHHFESVAVDSEASDSLSKYDQHGTKRNAYGSSPNSTKSNRTVVLNYGPFQNRWVYDLTPYDALPPLDRYGLFPTSTYYYTDERGLSIMFSRPWNGDLYGIGHYGAFAWYKRSRKGTWKFGAAAYPPYNVTYRYLHRGQTGRLTIYSHPQIQLEFQDDSRKLVIGKESYDLNSDAKLAVNVSNRDKEVKSWKRWRPSSNQDRYSLH